MSHLKCSTRTVLWSSMMPALTSDNAVMLMPVPSDGLLLLPGSKTSIPFSGTERRHWMALPLTSPNPSVWPPSVEPSRAP